MAATRPRATARLASRFGRFSRLALVSSAATAAVALVGVTVAAAPSAPESAREQVVSLYSSATAFDDVKFAQMREQRISRSATRLAPRVALEPKATDHKFATALLNIWEQPREEGKRLGVVEWGSKVAVTGQVIGQWAEVLVRDAKKENVRWVNADYLANTKPKPKRVETTSSPSSTTPSSGTSALAAPSTGGSCTNGSSAPGSPNIVAIHQARTGPRSPLRHLSGRQRGPRLRPRR